MKFVLNMGDLSTNKHIKDTYLPIAYDWRIFDAGLRSEVSVEAFVNREFKAVGALNPVGSYSISLTL